MKRIESCKDTSLVSVIIAAFNAEATIDRCISSILAAKKDYAIELIIIDDGSDDATAHILQRWLEDEPWITMRHQVNKGAATARNIGLDIATGGYTTFVDSDDTVDEWYFDFIFEKAVAPKVDMLVFGHKRIMLDGSVIKRQNIPAEYIEEDLHQIQLRVTENRHIYWLGCTRVFNSRIIEDLRFDADIKLGEDAIFIISFLSKAKQLSVVVDCPYNYYENPNSLTNLGYKESLLDSVEAHYKARVQAHEWPANANEKQILLSDIARSYVEHMLPFLLNNLRYVSIKSRYAELVKIRQSFIYDACIPNYRRRHPLSRGMRLLVLSFIQRRYIVTLALLKLSWSKKVKKK